MSRPPLEVADLIRIAGAAFIERSRKWISWKHIKVLLAIVRCRTAALGGHLEAFILAACENELKRGDSTEATAQLEARISATLANVTKEVQLLFTLTRRLPSQILNCSTF